MTNFIGVIRASVTKLTGFSIAALFGNVALARWRGVVVGEGCRLYIREFGTEPFLISIGDRVTVTQGCLLLTHDGSTWLVRNADGQRYQDYAPINIGNDVFVGANTIILPGVSIGDNVVIGAGSVVTKDVASGTVIAGNPARPICEFSQWKRKIEEGCVNESMLMGIRGYRARVQRAIAIAAARGRARGVF